jgi:ubiquinone/menaquinone biosynthesis C-methylase UbiE
MSFDPRTHYQDVSAAERYDDERFRSLSGRIFQWADKRSILNAMTDLAPGAVILDAPCGTGRISSLFLENGLKVIGGDISGQMMAVARKRLSGAKGGINFCRMDLTRLPLRDDAVTGAFSIRFLPHIPSSERILMLSELRRISQKWVVISVSISNPWHRLRRKIRDWLRLPKPVRYPVTLQGIEMELDQAGLRIVRKAWTFPILSEQILLVCRKF